MFSVLIILDNSMEIKKGSESLDLKLRHHENIDIMNHEE